MAIKDKIVESTNNIIQVTELLKTLKDKSGKYIWKKCQSIEISLTQTTSSTNPTIIQLSSNDIDLSTIDANFFIGLSGTYILKKVEYNFEFTNATTFTYNGVTASWSYDPSTAQISLNKSLSGSRTYSSIYGYTVIDYVVSDDESVYPDGAEQDGYYYEKIITPVDLSKEVDLIPENIREGIDIFGILGTMSEGLSPNSFGCSKYAVDTVIFPNDGDYAAASNTYITHSLGEVPKFAFLIPSEYYTPSNTIYNHCAYASFVHLSDFDGKYEGDQYFSFFNMINGNYGWEEITSTRIDLLVSELEDYVTDYDIRFYTDDPYTCYAAGIEYTLITMA